MPDGFVQRFVRLVSRKDGAWLGHPELRERLVADAKEQQISLTEMALHILARHYHVSYAPSGRRTAPNEIGEELNLRIPDALDAVIEASAEAHGSHRSIKTGQVPIQNEVRRVLCAHYGLAVPKTPKRIQKPRASSSVSSTAA